MMHWSTHHAWMQNSQSVAWMVWNANTLSLDLSMPCPWPSRSSSQTLNVLSSLGPAYTKSSRNHQATWALSPETPQEERKEDKHQRTALSWTLPCGNPHHSWRKRRPRGRDRKGKPTHSILGIPCSGQGAHDHKMSSPIWRSVYHRPRLNNYVQNTLQYNTLSQVQVSITALLLLGQETEATLFTQHWRWRRTPQEIKASEHIHTETTVTFAIVLPWWAL